MKTHIDTTPAPALKPFATFSGTIADRLARSPIAAKVMDRKVKSRRHK